MSCANPDRPPQWLIDLHPASGIVYVRRRTSAPVDGADPVCAVRERTEGERMRRQLCDLGPDNRYRLRQQMTLAQARQAFQALAERRAA